MVRYYIASSGISVFGLLKAVALFMLAAIVPGVIYGVFCAAMPFPYFTLIVLLLLGVFWANLSTIVFRLAVVRTRFYRLILVLWGSMVLWYVSWVAYIAYVSPNLAFERALWETQTWNPLYVYDLMHTINTQGAWSVGRTTPVGTELAVVWLIEFLVMCVLPFFLVYRRPVEPFSEETGRWYRRYDLRKDFDVIYPSAATEEALSQNPVEFLDKLGYGRANRHMQVILYFLEEENRQYLSLSVVSKGQSRPYILHHLLEISTRQALEIRQHFEYKRIILPL